MNRQLYERPREKLIRVGPKALSTTELLQIIIGSGSATSPVHKIAKKLSKLLARSGPNITLDALKAISGVGTVKAGQIVCLFELADRYPIRQTKHRYTDAFEHSCMEEIQAYIRQAVIFVSIDGGGRVIYKRAALIEASHGEAIIRRMMSECILDGAVSVAVFIGWQQQPLLPDVTLLKFAKIIYDLGVVGVIHIRNVTAVSELGRYDVEC